MKLGKTSWIILTIGILVVAFGSVGIARFQQIKEQSQLEEELPVAEMRLGKVQLNQLYSQQEELGAQLNQTVSQLEVAKDALRQSIESIEVTDSLFEIAEACGVEITAVSTPGVASDELAGIAGSVIQLSIMVDGDVPNLIDFVIKLNSDFTPGVVRSAGISIPGTAGEDNVSASIQLVVYTYQDE